MTYAPECLRTIPEIFETNVSESLAARTKILARVKGLGPPDLCHITKVQEVKQSLLRSAPAAPALLGSYHYVYGVDCSSAAGVAAYFNTLVNDMPNPHMSKGGWRIQSGTYCSYNAFARVDVRVEVTMPGTVNAYVVDAHGRRFGCDDKIWQETQICAVLRALDMPSPFTSFVDCLRVFQPLSHPSEEKSFLQSVEALFFEGKFLGTSELTSPPSNVNNRLTEGVKGYFFRSSRFAQGVEFFGKFVAKDPEIMAIIAEACDHTEGLARAVCLLAENLLKVPSSYAMLMKQSQLLLELGDVKSALDLAKLVVDLAPAQAQPWINLANTYTANGDYGLALVALNVTPMAHETDHKMAEMPEPLRLHNNNEAIREMVEDEEDGDETISSLPANNLRGTFVAAYDVLTRILTEITWDELLGYRSKVFLMEDEYTTFKQQPAMPEREEGGAPEPLPDQASGFEPNPAMNSVTGEKAAARREQAAKAAEGAEASEAQANDSHAESEGQDGDDARDGGAGEAEKTQDAGHQTKDEANGDDAGQGEGEGEGEGQGEGQGGTSEFATPSAGSLVDGAEGTNGGGGQGTEHRPAEDDDSIVGGKRLLERWLDQLFTALYQDLMCSVIWSAQDQHAKQNNAPLSRTVGDWLRYGQLSKRLNRKDEAVRAFQQCANTGFCLRALIELLDTYSRDGFVEETFTTAESVCAFYAKQHGLAPPSEVGEAIFRLIAKHGLSMTRQLGGEYVKKSPHIKRYLDYAVKWQVFGYDR